MKVIKQLANIDVESILKETKAIMSGHFKLTSGYHSEYYVQCARLLQYPQKTSLLIDSFLGLHRDKIDFEEIDTIISPAVGGILFGYLLAYKLQKKMIFAERKDGNMVIRRGFDIKSGERLLIAEDVVTTGGSVFEVIDICNNKDAKVNSVISIIDRSSKIEFPYPYYSFIKLDIDKYEPDNCPLCKQGIDIDYPGSRKD